MRSSKGFSRPWALMLALISLPWNHGYADILAEHDLAECTADASITGCVGGTGWGGAWGVAGGSDELVVDITDDPMLVTLPDGQTLTTSNRALKLIGEDLTAPFRFLDAPEAYAQGIYASMFIRFDDIATNTPDFTSHWLLLAGGGNTITADTPHYGVFASQGPSDFDFFVSPDIPELGEGAVGTAAFEFTGGGPLPFDSTGTVVDGSGNTATFATTQLVENETNLLVMEVTEEAGAITTRLFLNPACALVAPGDDEADAVTRSDATPPSSFDVQGFLSFSLSEGDEFEVSRVRIANSFIDAIGCSLDPPALASAEGICGSFNQVTLTFLSAASSLPLDPATATDPANYAVTNVTSGAAFNPVIDTISATDFTVTITFDDNLIPGDEYSIVVSGVEDSAGNLIDGDADTATFFGLGGSGLLAAFFDNTTLSSPIAFRDIVPNIDFDLGGGSFDAGLLGPNTFSARFEGFVEAPADGNYIFETNSDDGVVLFVDDLTTPAIDDFELQSATFNATAPIALQAGQRVPIVLEYFENTGQAVIQLFWRLEGEPPAARTIVPATALFTCDEDLDDDDGFSLDVSNPSQALNCLSLPVTIQALNDANQPITDFTGTVAISNNVNEGVYLLNGEPGNLVDNDQDDGAATFTFVPGNQGSVTLALQITEPTDDVQVTVTSASNNAIVATGDTADFVETGFQFLGANNSLALATEIAGRNFQQPVFLQAVESSEIDTPGTPACVPLLEGETTINLAAQCDNPGTCDFTGDFTVGGTSIDVLDSGEAQSFTAVTLTFDENGIASLPALNYDDAGALSLLAELELPDTDESTETIFGESNSFVVRPFALAVNAFDNGTPNPGGTASSNNGDGFVSAGSAFDVVVTAVAFDSADDTNNDGVPDAGADLSDNTTTTNFFAAETDGLSLAAINDARFTPVSNDPLFTPTLGNLNGVLTLNFASGIANVDDLNYDEVGSIGLDALVTNYLGGGEDVTGASGTVGRFFPDRFAISGNAEPACNVSLPFNYFGQPYDTVSFNVVAQNTQGQTVQNYDNAAFGFAPTANFNLSAEDGTGTAQTTRLNTTDVTQLWSQGVHAFNSSSDGDIIIQAASTDTPPAPELTLPAITLAVAISGNETGENFVITEDPDTFANTFGLSGAATDVLFGRLNVSNSFGPEIAPLTTTVFTEFVTGFDGDGNPVFELNSDDACTIINNENIIIGVGGDSNVASFNGASATVSVEGTDPNDGNDGDTLNNGLLTLNISEPSPNESGSFDLFIDLGAPGNNLDFLQFDFNTPNTDGTNLENDPSGTITFGQFRGSDRVIFWEELN